MSAAVIKRTHLDATTPNKTIETARARCSGVTACPGTSSVIPPFAGNKKVGFAMKTVPDKDARPTRASRRE